MVIERVAISQRTTNSENYYEPRDALAHDWHSWLGNSLPGSALLAVPNSPDQVDQWWEICSPDLLILSGGNDWGDSPLRDQTETRLFAKARDKGIGVFGVCRGLHTINVLFDGDPPKNIDSAVDGGHVARDHAVNISDELSASLGQPARQLVNSFHGQGLVPDQTSDQVVIFATSDDGIVEGIFHPTEPVLAVQWHPERKGSSTVLDKLLLDALIERRHFWGRGEQR